MKNSNKQNECLATTSPWLNPAHSSQISDQFKLIEEIKLQPEIQNWGAYFVPLEIFKWIDKNKAVDKFFKALATLAPMYPVVAYNRGVACWISPPPSGSGNFVWIVMGRDKTKKLRVCGTNISFNPWFVSEPELRAVDFFEQYDMTTTEREKIDLFSKVFSFTYKKIGDEFIRTVTRRCETFNTMPIYITVLTPIGSMAQITEAVIDGECPSDFSYEFTGEIS